MGTNLNPPFQGILFEMQTVTGVYLAMYYLMSLRMHFKLDVLGHGFNSRTQEDKNFKSSLGCLMIGI